MELKERLAVKRQEWADEAEHVSLLGTLKQKPDPLSTNWLAVRLRAKAICPP